jgi:hypothetical protein
MTHLKLFVVAGCLTLGLLDVPTWAQSAAPDQSSNASYLVRMERQTRDEDVCILVRSDGQFRLERVEPGVFRSRVFEGTLPASSLSELQQMVEAERLKQLSQSQINGSIVGADQDQFMVAAQRATGWQSLTFPSGAARKSFKDAVEPLVKWLDRAKQQPHPIPNEATTRCMPPQGSGTQSSAATGSGAGAQNSAKMQQSASNPYLMRILTDHFEENRTVSGHGADWQENASTRAERVCVVVYASGRYRMEKSKQEVGTKPETQVFLSALDTDQVKQLQAILDAPDLAKLQHVTTAVGRTAPEGERIYLDVPRGTQVQSLSFSSLFGVRTQAVGLKDNLSTGVDPELDKIKPLRKWLKSNVEDKKVPVAKDTTPTECIPSPQPE